MQSATGSKQKANFGLMASVECQGEGCTKVQLSVFFNKIKAC